MPPRRLLLALAAVSVAAVPALIGCSAAAGGADPGRSVVGMARRTDGSVVMVTAWCIGQREEEARVATFDGTEVRETLYVATGRSSDPVTVHTIGRPDALTPSQNQGLPPTGLLVAYNSGARQNGLAKRSYPSTAAVFAVDELPVTREEMPTELIAGDQQRISLQGLIDRKCAPLQARSD